jgi:hypothetical protein
VSKGSRNSCQHEIFWSLPGSLTFCPSRPTESLITIRASNRRTRHRRRDFHCCTGYELAQEKMTRPAHHKFATSEPTGSGTFLSYYANFQPKWQSQTVISLGVLFPVSFPTRARGSAHQKGLCSTFGCSLAVPRCRLKNARNARFTYEKGEWRLIRSDQVKSMISEF